MCVHVTSNVELRNNVRLLRKHVIDHVFDIMNIMLFADVFPFTHMS